MYAFLLHFWILWIFSAEEATKLIKLAKQYTINTGNKYKAITNTNVDGNIKGNVSEEFCMFVIKYKNLNDLQVHEFLKHIPQTVKNRSFTRKTLSYSDNIDSVFLKQLVYDLVYIDAKKDEGLGLCISNKMSYRVDTNIKVEDLGASVIDGNIFLEYYTDTNEKDNSLKYVVNALKCVSREDESYRYTIIKFNYLTLAMYEILHINYESFIAVRQKMRINFTVYKFYLGSYTNIKNTFDKYSNDTKPDNLDNQKVFGNYIILYPKLKISKPAKNLSDKHKDCGIKYNGGDSVDYKIEIYNENVMQFCINIKQTCKEFSEKNYEQQLYKITGYAADEREILLLESVTTYKYVSETQKYAYKSTPTSNLQGYESFSAWFERLLQKMRIVYTLGKTPYTLSPQKLIFSFFSKTEAYIHKFDFKVGKTQEDACKKVAEYLFKSGKYETIEVVDIKKKNSDISNPKEKINLGFFEEFDSCDHNVLDAKNINNIDWTGKSLLLTDKEHWVYSLAVEWDNETKILTKFVTESKLYLDYFAKQSYIIAADRISTIAFIKICAKLVIKEAIEKDTTILLKDPGDNFGTRLKDSVYCMIGKLTYSKPNSDDFYKFLHLMKATKNQFEEKVLAANDSKMQVSEVNIYHSQYARLIDECKNVLEVIFINFKEYERDTNDETKIIIYHQAKSATSSKVLDLVKCLESFKIENEQTIQGTKYKRRKLLYNESC